MNEFEQQTAPAAEPAVKGYDPMTGQPIYETAPVSNAEAPAATDVPAAPSVPAVAPKKKKGGLIALIIVLVVLLLAAAGVGGYFLFKNLTGGKNGDRILQGLENTMNSMLPEEFRNTKDGTVTVDADFSELPSVVSLPINGKISLLGHLKDGKAELTLKTQFLTSTIDLATLFASKDDLALKSVLLLGADSYGISLKDLEQNLDNSVLAPGSGTELALPQETFDTVKKFLPVVRDLMNADAEKMLDGLKHAVWDSTDRMNATTVTQESITVLEKAYKAKLVTVTLNGDRLVQLAEDLISWYEQDPEAKKIDAVISLLPTGSKEGYITDIRKQLEEQKDKLKNVSAEIRGYIDNATSCLVRLEARIVNKADGDSEEHEGLLVLSFLSDKDHFRSLTELSMDGEPMESSDSDWDRNAGTYTAKATVKTDSQEMTTSLSANLKYENGLLTLQPVKATIPSSEGPQELALDFITVTLSAKSDSVTIPAYKDLLTMTMEELAALLQKFSGLFMPQNSGF